MTGLMKFLTAGAIATCIQFLLLFALVEKLALPEIVAATLAYSCGAGINYLINYHLTFANNGTGHSQALPKFLVTVGLGMLLNLSLFSAAMYLLSRFGLEYDYLISQLFATIITTAANFLMHKFWIYSSHRQTKH